MNLLASARRDVLQSVVYYNEQKAGLGFEFAEEVDALLLEISQSPKRYSTVYKQARKARLRRFSHLIFYRINQRKKTIAVFAVRQTSQNPAAWKTDY
ncbi:MAG: type II toxin-antitoxin system RelE/ParE family toxin [Cytophagales bacterium]|nr:type II toxin-antitoxin system RelE/ParE family toxin [Cytophagales bacterium]